MKPSSCTRTVCTTFSSSTLTLSTPSTRAGVFTSMRRYPVCKRPSSCRVCRARAKAVSAPGSTSAGSISARTWPTIGGDEYSKTSRSNSAPASSSFTRNCR